MPAPLPFARLRGPDGRPFHVVIDQDGWRETDGDPFSGLTPRGPVRPFDGVVWDVPVSPRKIVCVGRNYRAHAKELGHDVPEEPILFLKPSTALLPHRGVIRLPPESARVDHEGEMAVILRTPLRRVDPERALAGVLGYTCLNDVTARDLQKKDVQFTRAKGFDTFCPLGPVVVPAIDPARLRIETFVNGTRRQSAPTEQMIFDVGVLLSYISRVMTLEPGDVVATGTPEGVGPLAPGDEVVVSIDGIGRLVNRVEAEAGAAPARA
jgi:2-keto-4-pentenoate hydratase/2-oxohepta-3-ene-1,7-dioic acid hydratase in catechol pathway